MTYPDPFLPAQFEHHLDHPALSRLSRSEILEEIAHWSGWLDRHDLVARVPKPGLVLAWGSVATGVTGTAATYLGVVGFVDAALGGIVTATGIAATFAGSLLGLAAKSQVAPLVEASDRVRFRVADLRAEVERRRRSTP